MPLELPAELSQGIPADVLSNNSIQRYNDIGSLMKGHIEAENYIRSGKAVALPAEDAKPEDLDKWKSENLPKFSKVIDLPPGKAEEYEFKFEGVSSDVLKNDQLLSSFRETAHKYGLSKAQAAGIAQAFATEIAPRLAPQGPQVEFIEGKEPIDALMKEVFKGETPQRLDEYKRGVEVLSMSMPELKDVLNDGIAPWGGKFTALGDHPTIVKLITEIGRLTGQDFGGHVPANDRAVLDAQEEIHQIMDNKEHPWHERWRKGDRTAREHMNELYKSMTGGR